MATVRKTITIQAPPEAVWALLGDLTRAPEYVPGVVAAQVEDRQRVCIDMAGNEIREAIAEYAPERHTYAFEHLHVPLPVQRSQGRFVVEADGAGSRVVLEWQVEPLNGAAEAELVQLIDGAANMTLDNLRQRIEAGA